MCYSDKRERYLCTTIDKSVLKEIELLRVINMRLIFLRKLYAAGPCCQEKFDHISHIYQRPSWLGTRLYKIQYAVIINVGRTGLTRDP
jgi:hypothetical protein